MGNSILLRRNCCCSWFTLLKRNHNNVKCSSLRLLSSERLESQNAFQIFYFLNFNLHHAERILWYRYKPRQRKLWGQKKGCFDFEEPGKVLINVACGPDKSSSSSQSVGSTNSVLGFSTYSLISLLQVGLSLLALSCHRLYKWNKTYENKKKMKTIKRTKYWLCQEERKEEREELSTWAFKKKMNKSTNDWRNKWTKKLMDMK